MMEVFLVYDAAQFILQEVGKVRIVNMINAKISGLTESVLRSSLHSVLVVFGQSKNANFEKQLSQLLIRPDDIIEVKRTLNKVVDQVIRRFSKHF